MNKTNPPTTFGVFKPVGHTLIAFYTADELQFAIKKLKELGFLASSMVQYSALEMVNQIDTELRSVSPLATFGYELDLIHTHADLAKKGCVFLVVDAPTEVLATQVAELVYSIKPAVAQQYGRFMIEDLTTSPVVPHTKSLAEQETDFTAEGSPAPGRVGAAKPASTESHTSASTSA